MDFRPARAAAPSGSVAIERAERKQRLAAAFRVFARFDLALGSPGHISVRDPEFTDRFWVNPFGLGFDRIRASDLSLVDHAGDLLAGGAINAAAFEIHAAIHRARPEVACVAHAHPVYGTAWSAHARMLDPINQDVCALFEDHVVFDEATGLVTDAPEAARIAKCLGPHKAAILRNHGLLTVGRSVDEAAWWFVLMERSCRVQIAAESVGTPKRIAQSDARATAAMIGTPEFGWFQFQSLYERALDDHPDLAD